MISLSVGRGATGLVSGEHFSPAALRSRLCGSGRRRALAWSRLARRTPAQANGRTRARGSGGEGEARS